MESTVCVVAERHLDDAADGEHHDGHVLNDAQHPLEVRRPSNTVDTEEGDEDQPRRGDERCQQRGSCRCATDPSEGVEEGQGVPRGDDRALHAEDDRDAHLEESVEPPSSRVDDLRQPGVARPAVGIPPIEVEVRVGDEEDRNERQDHHGRRLVPYRGDDEHRSEGSGQRVRRSHRRHGNGRGVEEAQLVGLQLGALLRLWNWRSERPLDEPRDSFTTFMLRHDAPLG